MILITRPKQENLKLEKILKKKKVDVLKLPLLTFNYLNKKIVYEQNKIFIIASLQAVQAINALKNKKIIQQSKFVVIGKNTSAQLKKIGATKIILFANDSKELVRKILKKNFIEYKFEYLCSSTFNKDFVEALKKHKFNLVMNFVYQTKQVSKINKKMIAEFQKEKINIAVFYSLFSARAFLTLVKKYKISNKILKNITYICLSERISSAFKRKGWKAISPKKPTQELLVRLLVGINFNQLKK